MLHELSWTIAKFLSENSKVKEIRAENEARYFLTKTGGYTSVFLTFEVFVTPVYKN